MKPQIKCREDRELISSLHSRALNYHGTVRIQSLGLDDARRRRGALALEWQDSGAHPTSTSATLGRLLNLFHLQHGNNNVSTSKHCPRQRLTLRMLLLCVSCRHCAKGTRPPATAGDLRMVEAYGC